jgi:hypothetical protein
MQEGTSIYAPDLTAAEVVERLDGGGCWDPDAVDYYVSNTINGEEWLWDGTRFRPMDLNPAWLAWNDGTVVKLAKAIDAGRRFADLPILADALEQAGCDDEGILAHCRSGREHEKGHCWVVDLLLGGR